MTLALLILIPLAFALAVLMAPAERARFIALLGTLVAGVFAVFAVVCTVASMGSSSSMGTHPLLAPTSLGSHRPTGITDSWAARWRTCLL